MTHDKPDTVDDAAYEYANARAKSFGTWNEQDVLNAQECYLAGYAACLKQGRSLLSCACSKYADQLTAAKEENEKLTRQLEEALKVIELYADLINWHGDDHSLAGKISYFIETIQDDIEMVDEVTPNYFIGGKRAREFLAKIKGEK